MKSFAVNNPFFSAFLISVITVIIVFILGFCFVIYATSGGSNERPNDGKAMFAVIFLFYITLPLGLIVGLVAGITSFIALKKKNVKLYLS